MPTISEFVRGFGVTEIVLSLFILACVILGREHNRIFRRKRDEKDGSQEG